ncbi:ATP-NAD kinase-like domain-containing protein [Suillus clintonianus]|uniref:ATP-NAD kinase-like domain-containing protein n=1 Tax=Suillus clintonianus TaxID=1904413 RepID=UPI001B8628A7|nr:ATP-NAD kinase-like domain-containing protein [Suillus clintonianus]KAG2149197.1 ATP-NAD kinase-like domain-containing protein [Suillus clintonianus]
MASSPLLVIYNPVCGNGTAEAFFHEHVFPRLEQAHLQVTQKMSTGAAGHAGTIVIEFLERYKGNVTVILGSGDGTLHEIINALSLVALKGVRENIVSSSIRVVLVPCGTANALYYSLFKSTSMHEGPSYKLKSLDAFIKGSNVVPLTLAITTLSSPPSSKQSCSKVAVSAVVTSTALHASILHDSESLRKEVPDIERFKIAARNNITQWYSSHVKLLPTPSTRVVEIYDPDQKTFVTHEDSDDHCGIVDVYGPFAYFLSTVNVDRLEPTFRITPLVSEFVPSEVSLDIVMVRPHRDPTFVMDTIEARNAFAEKSIAVLNAAYQDGDHINLRYTDDGKITSEGSGPTVVEYIRCGGWEWIPDDVDEKAHLLCSDGAIFSIETGGRAACRAAVPADSAGFLVYV